jgi:hypothetical protein
MLLSIISELQLIIRKRPIQYETYSLMTDTPDWRSRCRMFLLNDGKIMSGKVSGGGGSWERAI